MIKIVEINDERIAAYRNLHGTPRVHSQQGIFVAEGAKTVQTLLASELAVESMFALPKYYESLPPGLAERMPLPERCFTADRALMNMVVGFRLHQGIMAIGKKPPDVELDALRPPILVLAGIVNSENVGAIARSALAFGVPSLLVDSSGSSPYLRRAVRVSMGAVFHLDINHSPDLRKSIERLKREGHYAIIGAELAEGAYSLANYNFPERFALLVGSEGHGIAEEYLRLCDTLVSIPITNNVQSLNAAAASAILLYEAAKQRA